MRHHDRTRGLYLYLFLFLASFVAMAALAADRAESRFWADPIGDQPVGIAPHMASRAVVPMATGLDSAIAGAVDSIRAMQTWNDEGRLPLRNGFSRPLPSPVEFRLGEVAAASTGHQMAGGLVTRASNGDLIWSTSIHVEDAWRLRLHLSHVALPPGTVMWVYGSGAQAIRFDTGIQQGDTLWTPMVDGDTIWFEARLPVTAQNCAFDIDRVMQLFTGDMIRSNVRTAAGLHTKAEECVQDATCTTSSTLKGISAYRAAVGQMQFTVNGDGYVCTGALLTDKAGSRTPYFLTANHCISSAASASSLQVTWDYKSNTCGVWSTATANPSTSVGASLLVTNPRSDVTLLRLNSVPSNRTFLGWDSTPLSNSTKLYRISHPYSAVYEDVYPQAWSESNVSTSVPTCQGKSRPDYLYAVNTKGGTFGGSSGSPVIVTDQNGDGLYVVGQLNGGCPSVTGHDPGDGCDYTNHDLDGAFSTSYQDLKSFLNSSAPVVCNPDSTTLCLNNGRFRVRVSWTDFNNNTGNGQAIKYTPDSGLMWFFDSTNIEFLVKILNGCGLNNHYWVFAAATTNVQYTMTVTDSQNGTTKTYSNPLGTSAPAITDTGAFATCP
ncbi:MAG: trypsin-like peptidase domain-containing protein [Thermoanaerobaculia bacterium]